MRQSFRHVCQLLALVFVIGSIHLVTINYLNYSFPTLLLLKFYVLNAALAIKGYVLIRVAYALKTQLEGFIFLIGSFVKFGVLYMFFLADDASPIHDSRQAFLHLFIPYAICLIWEIVALAKTLNQVPKTAS